MATSALIKAQTAELFKQHREVSDESEKIFLENEIILLNINLALHKSSRYKRISIDDEDIEAVAIAALFLAVRSYDHTKSSFAPYACRVIDAEIIDLIRRTNRKKRTAEQTVLSLDREMLQGDKTSTSLLEKLRDDTVNVEQEFVGKQLFRDLITVCSSILSEIEFTVLVNYLLPRGERKSQHELGEMFSCSQSTIARTEKKSIKKLRDYIVQQEWGLELLRG